MGDRACVCPDPRFLGEYRFHRQGTEPLPYEFATISAAKTIMVPLKKMVFYCLLPIAYSLSRLYPGVRDEARVERGGVY